MAEPVHEAGPGLTGGLDPEAAFADVAERLRGVARRRSRAGAGERRWAAVLVPLRWAAGGGLEVVLIRRPDDAPSHPGQVACPGGLIEPGEESAEAALREAEEEIGVPRGRVDVLGALHDVDTSTGFVFTPWVGRIPADVDLVPEPLEVARIFSVPLAALADPEASRFALRPWEHAGRTYRIPFWEWEGETIWGATGRALLDLARLLYPDAPLS